MRAQRIDFTEWKDMNFMTVKFIKDGSVEGLETMSLFDITPTKPPQNFEKKIRKSMGPFPLNGSSSKVLISVKYGLAVAPLVGMLLAFGGGVAIAKNYEIVKKYEYVPSKVGEFEKNDNFSF